MRSLHPADAVHKGFGTIPTSILNFRARDLKISKFASGYSLAVLATVSYPYL